MGKRLITSFTCLVLLSLISCTKVEKKEPVQEEKISIKTAQATLQEYDQALRDIDVDKIAKLYHPNVSITVDYCTRTDSRISHKKIGQFLGVLATAAKRYKVNRQIKEVASSVSGDKVIVTSRLSESIELNIANQTEVLDNHVEDITHIKMVNGKYFISSIQSREICN